MDLLVPEVRAPAPILPSYVKLDMAFGVGAGVTLFDKSRYRSHGAITGAVWAAGLHGYCLDFDPTIPSYVEIPAAHTQLDFTSEDFSLIARIYPTDFTISRRVFYRAKLNTDGWYFYYDVARRMQFVTNQAATFQYSSSANLSVIINNWYTVGFSRSGASCLMYVDGLISSEDAGIHIDPVTCARSAKIGILNDFIATPFDGRIEFLRIFGGVALTASEHLAWHNFLA